LPDADAITTGVLRLLVQRPAETDTYCRYLEVAPLNNLHFDEIERLLVSEPLCIYEWQNFQLWRLASQRGIRTDQLVRKAHESVSRDYASPATAAAALYLGATGDYIDRQALEKKLTVTAHGLVRRCFMIAIQELNRSERNAAYDRIARSDVEASLLANHLQGLSEPIYVENPPRIAVEDLPDSMPSMYE
jgi:hypothetical protein